jgi:eukaryotic-like serine/threonine-protein kinase
MIADRYRLERKVGGGRVSAVWRVRDEITARACAIKILHRSMHKHPEALTRFSLEDRLARELSGPHFPERVGSGVWDGMRYIAWRWHDGESLRALFERTPKQDAPSVHSIVQETCQALSLVHAAGYAHGDLKPENIFFADLGESERARQIKLLGFGVASRLARASAAGVGVSRRRPGEFVGTPLYSSPDLILGRVPNGGQADLWALAVIVYEALTGRPPFLGPDIGAVLQATLEKRAPRPSSLADNLPGSFDTWWAQAMAQEFETPGEFAGALARALAPALRTSHTQRSASLPERLALPLAAVTPLPAPPPRASATSTTATGIGPADLGAGRPPPSPQPSTPPSPQPSASPVALAEPASPPFAPLPSPLRDLGADFARKTLVGIRPPIDAPLPAPPLASSGRPRMAIEGAPCKPIETFDSLADIGLPPDGVRRPANPTVPFPRPRVPRRTDGSSNPASDETPDIGHAGWHGTTSRTIRFVLTSPDHKPQRVAAFLVCAAAALVIFVLGRSPVPGTARIGQATESLNADPVQKSASATVTADPVAATELAAASGSDPAGDVTARSEVVPPREPAPLAPDELAPGLIYSPGDPARPAAEGSGADAAVPNSATGAKVPHPAGISPAAVPPAAKPPAPRKSTSPASLPVPPRKTSHDLDFGI